MFFVYAAIATSSCYAVTAMCTLPGHSILSQILEQLSGAH